MFSMSLSDAAQTPPHAISSYLYSGLRSVSIDSNFAVDELVTMKRKIHADSVVLAKMDPGDEQGAKEVPMGSKVIYKVEMEIGQK